MSSFSHDIPSRLGRYSIGLVVALIIIIISQTSAWAGCSQYLGRATINELFRQSSGRNPDAFAEVKRLDSGITPSIYNTWNLQLCRNGGGCITQPLSNATANLPWIVIDQNYIPYTYYDIAGGMDAILTDQNGDIIDYVSVANWSSNSSYLTACSYFYDTTANEALDVTFDVRREPDGSGDWNHSSGASGGSTTNDTNSGDSSGPAVSVPATLSVLQGETASISVSLDSPAPRGGVTISFELRDGTAVDGTDYNAPGTLSVTIPRGSSSAQISIPTVLTDKTTSSQFYLVLTNVTNAYITSQLTTVTIMPALNALLHLDESLWDGTSGEVTDDGPYSNNGTAKNGAYTNNTNPALSGTVGTCHYGEFDGVNDYVQIPDDSSLDFTDEFTVTAWINPASLPTGSDLKSFISKDTNYEFHVNSSGKIFWWWEYTYRDWRGRTRTASTSLTSNSSISTNSWTHIAIVYSKSSSRQRIYINGSLDKSASNSYDSLVTNNYPLYIAGDIDSSSGSLISSRFFHGLIDEVHVYKRALTSTEVSQVYNRRHTCTGGAGTIDHLRLTHNATALTCQGTSVTVEACANSDCSTLYTGTTTASLDSPSTAWSQNPVTFSGGSTTVDLSHTTAETVTLSATATSPLASNSTTCLDNNGGTTCKIQFVDTGIVIDGDDSDTNQESNIVPQIAGKPSNTGYLAKNILVRAVRKDDNSGACVAAVQNKTLTSQVSYTVPVAAEGLDDNTFTVTGANTANLTAATSSQSLQLAFDSSGTAPFIFTSADAGAYSLQIQLDLPVVDSGGTATGDTIARSDSSNTFVVRPLAVFSDATSNPKAQDATGNAFTAAGEAFSITLKPLRWTSARDTNSDGQWDSCSSSTLSDPGTGYSRVPEWNFGQPQPILRDPTTGVNGSLTYSGDLTFAAKSTSVTDSNVSYSEVGIIQLLSSSGNDILGESVNVCTPYIGRFYPASFAINHTHHAACSTASTPFTYAGLTGGAKDGQPFTVDGTITALNKAGNTTQNYIGTFAKLTYDQVTATPNGGSGSLLTWSVDPLTFTSGVSNFTSQGSYGFSALAAPQTIYLTISANDGEASGSESDNTKTVEYRLGRLLVLDAYGPQTSDLKLPLVAQYYNGTDYVDNTIDSCTGTLLTSYVAIADTTPDTDTLDVAGGDTSVSDITPFLSTGIGSITLSAPGPGAGADRNEGTAVTTLDLSSFTWLRDDTDSNGTYDNDPVGNGTFGSYRGDDRFLFWKETQ